MTPLTSQWDDSWLRYSNEKVGGSQTKSDKISQYIVLILLISGIEKLMIEWVNELIVGFIS